jgi:hypothetical protein
VAAKLRIFQMGDTWGLQESGQRPLAQGLVDLALDDVAERFLKRPEDLDHREQRGRDAQQPHQSGSGRGPEPLLHHGRNRPDEGADREGESERQDAARQGGYGQEDDKAAFGERKEAKDIDTQPKEVGLGTPHRSGIRCQRCTPLRDRDPSVNDPYGRASSARRCMFSRIVSYRGR